VWRLRDLNGAEIRNRTGDERPKSPRVGGRNSWHDRVERLREGVGGLPRLAERETLRFEVRVLDSEFENAAVQARSRIPPPNAPRSRISST
jgi:hypothetical protein